MFDGGRSPTHHVVPRGKRRSPRNDSRATRGSKRRVRRALGSRLPRHLPPATRHLPPVTRHPSPVTRHERFSMIRFAWIAALLAALSLPTMGCRGVAMRLMTNTVQKNLEADLPSELPDGLHVLLCGAGGPLASANRSGPCVAIIAGETVVVVDSGSAAARNLGTMGLPLDRSKTSFSPISIRITSTAWVNSRPFAGPAAEGPSRFPFTGRKASRRSSMASTSPTARIRPIAPRITARPSRRHLAGASSRRASRFRPTAKARSSSSAPGCRCAASRSITVPSHRPSVTASTTRGARSS
jgi:hypothetical protein